jgi:hypothetical protein
MLIYMIKDKCESCIEEKNQIIKNLQKDKQFWRQYSSKILDAYFELHKYCNEK